MTMNRQRLDPENRKELILSAAYELAFDGALLEMTPGDVVEAMGVDTSISTLKHYFGSLETLKTEVVKLAIERECMTILATAIVANIEGVHDVPIELKQRVFAHLQSTADDD